MIRNEFPRQSLSHLIGQTGLRLTKMHLEFFYGLEKFQGFGRLLEVAVHLRAVASSLMDFKPGLNP